MSDIIDELERGAMKSRETGIEFIKTPPADILLLIAEIRRLRGENKMLYQMVDDAIAMAAHRRTGLIGPDRVEHRKCPKCTGTAILDGAVGENWCWAKCQRCGLLGLMRRTEAEAWAAWDGVEG